MLWKDLPRKDMEHLRKIGGVRTKREALAMFARQAELREIDGREPCYECKRIATKLGKGGK